MNQPLDFHQTTYDKRLLCIAEHLKTFQTTFNQKLDATMDTFFDTTTTVDENACIALEERMQDLQTACYRKLDEFTDYVNRICEEIRDIDAYNMPKSEVDWPKTEVDYALSETDENTEFLVLAPDDDCAIMDEFPIMEPSADFVHFESTVTPAPPALPITSKKPLLFQCDFCSKRFTAKQTLVIHRRTHTGDNALQCDICKRQFVVKQSLEIHMRTHTVERPFMCHLCSKTFKQSSPFRRHLRTHTDYKPYKCPVCARAFFETQYLRTHMQSHTGERPHVCPMCQRGYSKRYHVRQHLKNAHKVRAEDLGTVFPSSIARGRRCINSNS